MEISVLMASFKRQDILRKTLESLKKVNSRGIQWEILLIDNANDAKTKTLVEEFKSSLPIHYLVENRKGKNSSLNQAITKAQGDLFIFTDDDVIVDSNWLKEYQEGVKRWPQFSVFGGRILPLWPDGMKPFPNINKSFFQSAYSIADWSFKEGPYEAGKVWGPNMAIRKKIFDQDYCFNEKVGPSGNNYIMGSETELTKRLENDGFKSVYLPKALVHHQIRPEQMSQQWLYQRAFRYGRADTFHEIHPHTAMFFGAPRYMYRLLLEFLVLRWKAILAKNESEAFNLMIKYWMTKGRIYQYRCQPKKVRDKDDE